MTSTVLLLPFALAVLVLWFTYRTAQREVAGGVAGPVQQRVAQRLRDRVARGEISTEDYDRLMALMR